MSKTVTVPEWLNESFFLTVLKQDAYRDKEIRINSVEVTLAVPPGTNYVSDLFRIRGRYQEEDDPYQTKEISVILKVLVIDNYIGKYLEERGIMKKEYIAYREFLPKVYNVLPKLDRFTAKLLYSPAPKSLVLEDLKYQGFVMADRLKQLDFDHCLVCIKTLAKFHAVSVAVVKSEPEFITTLGKESMYDGKNTELKEEQAESTKSVRSNFTLAVQTWEGFEDFEEKSSRVWETLLDNLYDVFEPRKDSLNVMNHGDLWTNNMLFKYDDGGNIVDFRLLDWQLCRYGTPVTDLLYFLFTSANYDVRENRMDELITAYLETLNSVFQQLDREERLTREQLDAEIKRCQCYIFATVYSSMPLILSDPDDLVNMDEMTEENVRSQDNNPFLKCYYAKYFKVIAQQVLRYLDKVVFFER